MTFSSGNRGIEIVTLAACVMLMAGETRAVKPGREHPTVGLYSGRVDKAIELGVDVLMPSITWHNPQGYLRSITERAHAAGLRMYPSLAVAYDGYQDERHAFAEAHPQYWEKRRDGRLIDSGTQVGLTFGSPEVRAHKVKAFVDLVESTRIDGILLDYARFFGNTAGYHDLIVSAFKEKTGRDPYQIPSDDPEWIRHRAGYVTQFVVELREALDARFGTAPERVKLIACVNPDPEETLRSSMQDWATWLDRGLIDSVVTMIYERDTNDILEKAMIANRAIRGRVPHMPMVAPYGGSLTTPELLREASHKCLSTATGAVAFYRDDSIEEYDLWDTLGEIAHWDLAEVQRRPVNYVLNSGFERDLENWAVGDGESIAVVSGVGRQGSKALRITGRTRSPYQPPQAVRQIIDRGFVPGASHLHVSAWVRRDGGEGGRYAIEVNINYGGAREEFYRIPLELPGDRSWQQIQSHVPMARNEDVRFILLSMVADSADGTLDIDDVAVHLAAGPAEKGVLPLRFEPATDRTDGSVNIVRGQPVKGSSFWENGFDYANAVNGNLSSENYGKGAAWHSQRPARDQWITIYLPAVHTVSRARLLNSSAQSAYRTREYRLEVSLDDHTWQEVAAGTLPDDGETWTEVEFPPSPAKYIRFTGVTGYHLDYAVGLKEIEVY